MSPSTGIILNDIMDDFSYPNMTNDNELPPSPNNFPASVLTSPWHSSFEPFYKA